MKEEEADIRGRHEDRECFHQSTNKVSFESGSKLEVCVCVSEIKSES